MASSRARYRPPVEVQDEPPEPPSPDNHSHKQPREQIVRRNLFEAFVGVLAIACLILTYQNYRLQQGQNDTTLFIEDARTRRDAQNEELNRRINLAVCDVLDQLPAGGLFDPIRSEYGCGPGIPVDELDPQAAQNLADILGELEQAEQPEPGSVPQATSPNTEMPPGAPEGARPSPMGQAPTTTPPTASETTPTPTAAATSVPPLIDLSTVTDRVCNALGICL